MRASSSGGSIIREVLSRDQRTKLDPQDDRAFYSSPRLVKHVDDHFLAQLTQLYRERIPEGAAVLDLCSSWISHLPEEKSYAKVVGHGLNAAELSKNRQLSEWFVRNLNKEPSGWALGDESFDAVVMCVSIQYLEQPELVFAEIYRVLKPGGIVVISYSNRMFYQKAVKIWRDNSDFGRLSYVKSLFGAIDGFTPCETVTRVALTKRTGLNGFIDALRDRLVDAGSDPFFAVVCHKDFRPAAAADSS